MARPRRLHRHRRHDGTGPGAARLHGLGLYVPHVCLDSDAKIHADLGLEHARMWTQVVERLKTDGTYARVLQAIAALEAETLRAGTLASGGSSS